jgi:hypothetical protein
LQRQTQLVIVRLCISMLRQARAALQRSRAGFFDLHNPPGPLTNQTLQETLVCGFASSRGCWQQSGDCRESPAHQAAAEFAAAARDSVRLIFS